MDMWKFYDITHRNHVICNPTSGEKLGHLVEQLRLPAGVRVIDIACGKGEFLIRLAEAYGVNCLGIDLSPFFIAEARKRLEVRAPEAEVCIHENEMRAHGVQIHRDSESILAHWQLADPHMRDVMQYITTTRVDIYGQPNEAVMEGMRRLSSQGAVISVTPLFVGFSRLPGIE